MKAAVFHGIRDIRIEEVEDPVFKGNEVLLRPHYCGICGSDLDAWNRGMYVEGVVLGHEFSAEVMDTGSEVANWRKGDRVVVNSIVPCRRCLFCQKGRYSLCDDMKMPGISMNGGLAELVVAPEECLIPVPDTVSMKEAALTEPLSVVLHGFNLITFNPGMKVLVIGGGTIGLFALQVAQLIGATFTAVSEVNSFRREVAGKLGADLIVDPSESNISFAFEQKARHLPDTVIECSGVAAAASETFSLVQKGGTILVLGLSEDIVEADFMTSVLNELQIQFSYCGYSEFPLAVELMAKKMVDLNPLITKEIPLDDTEKGFQELTNLQTEQIKILVRI
ncbi:MAG: alcohol dehydrogenase catalytic domain-containing protein [Theionarchaea archaeon]|nr:alcohol dehydrogenase catalytic domain-containing protein [Theionarchaea archaeon]